MSDKLDGSNGKNQIESLVDIPTAYNAGRSIPKSSRNSRNKGRLKTQPSSQISVHVDGTQSLLTKHSSHFISKNQSIGTIVSKYFNANVLKQSYRSLKDQTLELNLTIKIFEDRLKAQANVWARKVTSYNDLNLKAIIGKRNEDWQGKLEHCYIYSFYTSILYSLSDLRVAEFSEERYLLKGHLILHKYLQTPSHTFQHDDYNVRYNFRIDKERCDEILILAKKNLYIKNFIGEYPRFYLENEELDRILGGLHKSMPLGGPLICKTSDTLIADSSLSKDFFALANSFYTNDGNCNEWSYSFRPDSTLITNSTLFGKSCFMSLHEANDISNFYDKIDIDDGFYLTKYEVSNICGSDYPNYINIKI